MPVFYRGYGQPQGNQVVLAAQNLPQTATATLFSVSGTVLVQALFGIVSTAIGATPVTMSLGNTPTGGSATNTSICTAGTITSKPVGTLFAPTWASGIGSSPTIASAEQYQSGSVQSFIVPAGAVTWTTSASTTGQLKFYISWLPIDTAATLS